MGRVTQFVKIPSAKPPNADEFNRLQDRLVEALRVVRQSPQALLDAKGSLISASAAGAPVEHAVGTNGQALIADSTTTTGLRWGSAGPFANILDYGAVAGGLVDSTAAFALAWAVSPVALVPAGNFLISGVSVPFGKSILGLGPSQSRLTYAGTGGAVVLDGCQQSSVSGLEIVTTSTASTVRGIWLKNTSVGSVRNALSRLLIVTTSATPRATGQFGILIEDNAATTLAQFWHRVVDIEIINYETCIGCLQTGAGADGSNASFFSDIVCASFISGLSFGPRCGDHIYVGISGTHSSPSAFSDTLIVIGDGIPSNPNSTGNLGFGINADLGANGRAFIINAHSLNNTIFATNESGQADVDNGTDSFASSSKNLSGLSQRFTLSNFRASNSSAIAGTLLCSKIQDTQSRLVHDTDVTLSVGDFLVEYDTLTATRTITLPAATIGLNLIINDGSSNASGAIQILVTGNINGTPGATAVAVQTSFGSSVWRVNSVGTTWFKVAST